MADFEKVFQEYKGFIYKYLLKLCRDESLAEELTQETFFAVKGHFCSVLLSNILETSLSAD